MDKKAYLYIVEAGQFSFEVEIKELLGKVGDTICISTDGIDPDGFDVKITCIEEDYYVYCWLCKLNCVMLYSHSISSVGERPATRGGNTSPDECKITTI